MTRLLLVASLAVLAGCPSTTPAPNTVRRGRFCPDESCGTGNGPRRTGVARHDAPAPVPAIHLPSRTSMEVKP